MNPAILQVIFRAVWEKVKRKAQWFWYGVPPEHQYRQEDMEEKKEAYRRRWGVGAVLIVIFAYALYRIQHPAPLTPIPAPTPRDLPRGPAYLDIISRLNSTLDTLSTFENYAYPRHREWFQQLYYRVNGLRVLEEEFLFTLEHEALVTLEEEDSWFLKYGDKEQLPAPILSELCHLHYNLSLRLDDIGLSIMGIQTWFLWTEEDLQFLIGIAKSADNYAKKQAQKEVKGICKKRNTWDPLLISSYLDLLYQQRLRESELRVLEFVNSTLFGEIFPDWQRREKDFHCIFRAGNFSSSPESCTMPVGQAQWSMELRKVAMAVLEGN